MGMTAVLSCSMAVGGLISSLTFTQLGWALILGLAILVGVFYIPLGKIGANEGLNTYIIGEAAFGEKGSSLATSLIANSRLEKVAKLTPGSSTNKRKIR